MLTEIAVLDFHIAIVSPRTSNKAGLAFHPLFRGEFTALANKSNLNVRWCRRSKNISAFNTDEFTAFKIRRRATENKINAAFNYAVLKIEGTPCPLGKLLRTCKAAGDYLLVGQGSEKQRVLMSSQNAVFKSDSVAVEIERDSKTSIRELPVTEAEANAEKFVRRSTIPGTKIAPIAGADVSVNRETGIVTVTVIEDFSTINITGNSTTSTDNSNLQKSTSVYNYSIAG